MKKRVERNTVTTVIFAIVFAILIIYALFVIITLLWGVMTSLKSLEDINGGFNFYTRKTTKYPSSLPSVMLIFV